ncbi:MAG: alanine--glyoxylate aminotransferase family protein [Deltaproteobacteria bacterium]|uniref:Alanine--glyoxylate aminotransferase family protein n=1 Tax=Candidatus Zymogenus saltonus TaxID=2844893 RepID=A0A9D8KD63_9DELT|nr:alanine--glyoxylate aminotransferase family protein [Candidatus Zymogenus saltonus]
MKKYLMTPGPTPIPERVLLAMAEPIIHHRAPRFSEILEEVREGLKYLYQSKNEIIIHSSSGTGAMEAAVVNTLSTGDKVITVRGGKFGERWAEISQAYGLETINIDVTWGEAVDPALIEDALKKNRDVKAVMIQASETSTGVAHPVKEVSEIVRKLDGTLFIVDAISALGVVDLPTDEWGLDVVVSGSQKGLMLPPGLAFASVSEKAKGFMNRSNLPKYYFDFAKEEKNLLKNQNAYTPAISLIVGLAEALKIIREIGLENLFHRYSVMGDAVRKGAVEIGLELFAPTSPSNSITAIKAPAEIDGGKIVKTLRETHGITVAGGQAELKGKIFRIAHMGYVDTFDIIMTIAAVEMTLSTLGFKVDAGKGVGIAEEILKKLNAIN